MDKEKLTGLWAVAISILTVIIVGVAASLLGGCGGTYTDAPICDAPTFLLKTKVGPCTSGEPSNVTVTTLTCFVRLYEGTQYETNISESYTEYHYLESDIALWYKDGTRLVKVTGVTHCANSKYTTNVPENQNLYPTDKYCTTKSQSLCIL